MAEHENEHDAVGDGGDGASHEPQHDNVVPQPKMAAEPAATAVSGPAAATADGIPDLPPAAADGGSDAPKLGAGSAVNQFDPAFPGNAFVNGYIGRLSIYVPTTVGGTPGNTPVDFPIRSMSFNEAVETSDITTTAGSGCGMVLPGIRRATGEISFLYDAFAIPNTIGTNTGTVSPFRDGTYIKLVAKPDGVSTIAFVALITNVSMTWGTTAGAIIFNCSYASHGSITNPTQSLAVAPAPLYS